MSGLLQVREVLARSEPFAWPWAEESAELVEESWRERLRGSPALFDGTVLMLSRLGVEDGRCEAHFFPTRYARMLAWLDRGAPDPGVSNGFAMGALLGSDGGFVLGRMADGTANAGRLYFPCGTPDLSDVGPDGRVDLEGSIRREIAEEAGLGPADGRLEPGWTIVRAGGLTAFIRLLRLRMTADEAAERIGAHLLAEDRPELAGVEIVRRPEEIAETRMPPVMPLYLRWAFSAGLAGAGPGQAG